MLSGVGKFNPHIRIRTSLSITSLVILTKKPHMYDPYYLTPLKQFTQQALNKNSGKMSETCGWSASFYTSARVLTNVDEIRNTTFHVLWIVEWIRLLWIRAVFVIQPWGTVSHLCTTLSTFQYELSYRFRISSKFNQNNIYSCWH